MMQFVAQTTTLSKKVTTKQSEAYVMFKIENLPHGTMISTLVFWAFLLLMFGLTFLYPATWK